MTFLHQYIGDELLQTTPAHLKELSWKSIQTSLVMRIWVGLPEEKNHDATCCTAIMG